MLICCCVLFTQLRYTVARFNYTTGMYGTFLENAMYASRWLLAPVYFGLSLALVALALKFFQEIIHVLPNIFSMAESDLILVLLSLVDMTLVGGLLVMVMFSGYEHFVTTGYLREQEKLNWLGKWMQRR